jgi:hypothetical protein
MTKKLPLWLSLSTTLLTTVLSGCGNETFDNPSTFSDNPSEDLSISNQNNQQQENSVPLDSAIRTISQIHDSQQSDTTTQSAIPSHDGVGSDKGGALFVRAPAGRNTVRDFNTSRIETNSDTNNR